MAIQRQVFKDSGKNTAVIPAGAAIANTWPGCFRFRMTENQGEKYGPCNTLRMLNKSARKIQVRFGLNIEDGEPFYDMEPNSIMNITVDDGIAFYGFDVVNLDTATDVPIGEVQFTVSRVEQIENGQILARPDKLGVF